MLRRAQFAPLLLRHRTKTTLNNMPGPIEQTTAWKALEAHAERVKRVHLRDLLQDASRNAALAQQNAGLVDEYNVLADQVGAQRAAAAAALVIPEAPAVAVQPVPAQTPQSEDS